MHKSHECYAAKADNVTDELGHDKGAAAEQPLCCGLAQRSGQGVQQLYLITDHYPLFPELVQQIIL